MNNKRNFDYTESLYLHSVSYSLLSSEAAHLRRSYEKLFWKYATNLQDLSDLSKVALYLLGNHTSA